MYKITEGLRHEVQESSPATADETYTPTLARWLCKG